MSFDYHVRRREDPLNAGIFRALRGEIATNDQSPNPNDWSPEKIALAHEEAQREADWREAGAWPDVKHNQKGR